MGKKRLRAQSPPPHSNHGAEPHLRFKRFEFRWNLKARLALLILTKFYQNNYKEVEQVFNKLFYDDLVECGFFREEAINRGIGLNALRAQAYELNTRNKYGYEEMFEALSFDDMTSKFQRLHQEIVDTADLFEISLVKKAQPSSRQRNTDNNRIRRRSQSSDSDTSTSTGELSDPDEEQLSTDFVYKSTRKSRAYDRRKHMSFELPHLLFRTFSTSSAGINGPQGLMAKAFEQGKKPDISDLVDHAAGHFSKNLGFSSPLISLTRSFVWALHIAKIKLDSQHLDVCIAVIDVAILKKTKRITWHGRSLVKEVDRAGKKSWAPENYRGSFEYLVWQDVPAASIISCIKMDELESLVLRTPCVRWLLRWDCVEPNSTMREIRKGFEYRTSSEIWGVVVKAIGKLIRFIKPNVLVEDQFIEEFTRAIFENFSIHPNTQTLLEDEEFKRYLLQAVNGSRMMDGLKMETDNDFGYITPPATPQKSHSRGQYQLPAPPTTPVTPSRRSGNHATGLRTPSYLFSPYERPGAQK